MINFKIENGVVNGNISGTAQELFIEYALLTYSFWAQFLTRESKTLEEFLNLLQETVLDIPEAYDVKTTHLEDNSHYITDKTGVIQ